ELAEKLRPDVRHQGQHQHDDLFRAGPVAADEAGERGTVVIIVERDRLETFSFAGMHAQAARDDLRDPVEGRFKIGGVWGHVFCLRPANSSSRSASLGMVSLGPKSAPSCR